MPLLMLLNCEGTACKNCVGVSMLESDLIRCKMASSLGFHSVFDSLVSCFCLLVVDVNGQGIALISY